MNKTNGMPAGVNSLYFIQIFSTFSYAILYGSLSLYLTKQLGLSVVVSNSLVGLFLALNYLLHLIGGFMGGRYFSNRGLYVISTLIQTIGIGFLAFSELYIGLSLFLIGSGFNTVSHNNMMTQRFEAGDLRRERAFFISYAAMNAGFFAGFSASGFYDSINQYQQLFYIGMITNLICLFFMALGWKHLGERSQDSRHGMRGFFLILLVIPLMFFSFHLSHSSNILVILAGCIVFLWIVFLGKKQKLEEDKQKIRAFLMLGITSIIFWMIYFTGPMGVTIFIKNNVDKQILNYEIATQWIFNINTIIIVFCAPLLARWIHQLQTQGWYFPLSSQFKCAFILLALSFFSLAAGIQFSNEQGYAGIIWVVLHFIFQSLGELLIAPAGYAMIGRVIPEKLQGFFMGSWMMTSGISASIAHYFSNSMTPISTYDPLLTNPGYWMAFNKLGVYALFGAIFLYLITRKGRMSILSA